MKMKLTCQLTELSDSGHVSGRHVEKQESLKIFCFSEALTSQVQLVRERTQSRERSSFFAGSLVFVSVTFHSTRERSASCFHLASESDSLAISTARSSFFRCTANSNLCSGSVDTSRASSGRPGKGEKKEKSVISDTHKNKNRKKKKNQVVTLGLEEACNLVLLINRDFS